MITNISDLIYINEAAKAFKYKEFIWFNNMLMGLDNINTYIGVLTLDVNKLSAAPMNGLIIDQKELSKFVKALTTESSFQINEFKETILYTNIGAEQMTIFVDDRITSNAKSKYQQVLAMDEGMSLYSNKDMTKEFEQLFNMHKGDGGFYYIIDGKYYITLFNGLLPLNKSDKIFVSILDKTPTTFIARYTVIKSKFVIRIYTAYLKVL